MAQRSFLENAQQNGMEIIDSEFGGRKPLDWGLKLLECRGNGAVWKGESPDIRSSFKAEIVACG